LIASVEVTAPVPEIATGWATEHVGESAALDGPAEIAQVSATLPVNPPLGVTVMVELVDPPCAMGAVAVELNENVPEDAAWMV
jgi:hypothetical protein